MSDQSRWRRLPWNARRNIGREVDEELRFHIDALAEELIALGHPEREARAEAERRFGTVSSVRDECMTIDRRRQRRLTWSELLMLTALDFRVALRALRRAPAYSLAIIGTLVIGIGAAAAIFTIVNAVLLRPLPYRNPERLVSIRTDMARYSFNDVGVTQGLYYTYKALSHTLPDIAMYHAQVVTVRPDSDADAERVTATWATANLFPILGVGAELGRTYSPDEDTPGSPPVVVISDGLWRSRFGADPNVLGKALPMGGGGKRTIVGVMPPSFHFPDARTEIWYPAQLSDTQTYMGGFTGDAIARLAPGADLAAAQREIAQLLPRVVELHPMNSPGFTMKKMLIDGGAASRVVPLYDFVVGDARQILWLIAGTAGLVLLVTVTNTTNLLLVRADARRRELSVRAALGAGTGRVLAHFFAESVLLGALAAALAFGAAWLAVLTLVREMPVQLPRIDEVRVDGSTALFTIVFAILVAAVCNTVPAMRFLRTGSLSGLHDAGSRGGTIGGARQLTRATLVTAQLALAFVALITSGLLLRSFEHARAIKPGYNAEQVATLWVGVGGKRYPKQADVVHFFAELARAVAAIPGVTDAGVSSRPPFTPPNNLLPLFVEGRWDKTQPVPPLTIPGAVDAGYFRTMQIPLVAGRLFQPIEAERGDAAVVSQETARVLFGDSTGARVIGKQFQVIPDGWVYTVVGVVGSTRDTSLFHPPSRAIYFPESVSPDTLMLLNARTMAVVARTTGDVDATLRGMRQAVHNLDPTLATFDARPLSAVVAASIARLTFMTIILGAAAAVTLTLGLLGLYGVIAYVVTLRTRELGLRIALGATPIEVSRMVARQGLVLGVLGAATGLGLAALTTRTMKSFLFGVAPLDPTTLAAAVIALIGCALLASWLPARRAGRVDPAVALKAD